MIPTVEINGNQRNISHYLEFLAFFSAATVLAADLANSLGFKTFFGLNAFLILKTAHAVPMACPAASSPSVVALAASSPYLYKNEQVLKSFSAPN